MSFIDLLGWAAGALTTMTSLPQLFKLWRSKDSSGVALGTYGAWVSTAAWWALWSAEVGAWPSFYMNAVCLLLDIAVVAFLRPSPKVWLLVAAGPVLGLFFINNTTILLCVAMALQLYVALPTLALVLKNRPVSGLSAGTWAAVLSSNILWVAYMLGIGQPQSTVVDFVAGVCAVVILVRIKSARKTAPLHTPFFVTERSEARARRLVITSPPLSDRAD